MAQLGVIGADQRIRCGDRTVGHTRVETAHGQHGMVQVVFAEDDNGALGRKPALHQRLADAARSCQCLRIADVLPVARAAVGQTLALGDEAVLRRGLRPVQQPVRHAQCMGLQILLGADVAAPVIALAHLYAAHAKFQLAVPGLAALFDLAGGLHGRVCLLHGLVSTS